MSREIKLEIGRILFNGGSPMMRYKVTAEIKREKNIQYEIECLDCNHGDPCRVLITKNDHNKFVYVGMVNESADDDFSDRHYYFHKNNGCFWTTKEDAQIEKLDNYIRQEEKELENLNERILYKEKYIKELDDSRTAYQELLNKINCQ